jgi:protein-S-isoprenylcysteine O-methyltransferase Ste14
VSKPAAILGSILFFLAAPCVAAGLIPWLITRWELKPAFFGFEPVRAVGVILLLPGVLVLVDSFARFALDGFGTPAPPAPTQKLVMTGFYRHVRNPMYAGIVAAIWGQALLIGNWALFVYGVLFWLVCHVFVVAYEEKRLERVFGLQYQAFRTSVPRWIPRIRPWKPS